MGIKSDAQSIIDGALAWSQLKLGSTDFDDDLLPSPLDVLPIGVCVADARALVYGNRAASEVFGKRVKCGVALDAFSERHSLYLAGTDTPYPTDSLPLTRAAHGEACSADDLELRRGTERVIITMQAAPLHDRTGRVLFAVATVRESATRGRAQESLMPDSEIRVSRNLEAIGQLAAGVAHEINTPMQYIGDNTAFLDVTVRRLLDLAGSFENLIGVCRGGGRPSEQLLRECERGLSQRRISFLRKQAPAAIEQTIDGIDQVRTIVQALKEFSHPGDDEAVPVDINRLVRMASTVTRNAWRYVAELQLELGEALPTVSGHPQELGQVLINLIVNAAHAIEERMMSEGERRLGTITLRTRANGRDVEIDVGDDGAGIPEAVRARIMDPFFTTKPAGKGTGQGLPLVQRVIVERHRGRLTFESEVGVGTTFHIVLPGRPDD